MCKFNSHLFYKKNHSRSKLFTGQNNTMQVILFSFIDITIIMSQKLDDYLSRFCIIFILFGNYVSCLIIAFIYRSHTCNFFISFKVTVFSLPLSFFIYHKVGDSCNFFLMSFCCKMESLLLKPLMTILFFFFISK